MMANKWMVCVRCYTYNQSRYINDALNGFVIQQTNFPFVCCIVDDASTDGEQAVIKKYVAENFDLQDSLVAYEMDVDYGHVSFARHKANKNCFFAVIYLKENHYSQKKTKAKYLAEWMDVKYIALCEGDDYWTDPLKLQKQVEFLESHPDYGFVGTNVIVDVNGIQHEEPPMVSSGSLDGDFELIGDVFEYAKYGPPVRMVSLCYVKEVVAPYNGLLDGDIVLETALAKQSKYAFYRSYACVYRQGIGISSSMNDLQKALKYDAFIVRSRQLQMQLFPEDIKWNEDELHDRGVYIRLIYSIREMKWKEALQYKKMMKSFLYKNKSYCKYLFGPLSCFVLYWLLRFKPHE